ncbi:MAG: SRPBCC domain-containing protein [Candidatus Brachytrichaceae bacterium NZ_4S206]|jgi:uncharacterized protein YndB with AHSA1/START domain
MATKTVSLKRTINAPAEHVYRAFTNATSLREWFCDGAMVQPRVGGRLYCQWDDGHALMGKYTALMPEKKIALDLRSDAEGSYSQCVVALATKDGVTLLQLTDSSDGKLWIKTIDECEANWNAALDNLKSVLETGVDLRLARQPVLGVEIGEPKPGDEGVRLDGVTEGMGAREAGLQQGDVILSVSGKKTPSWNAIGAALNGHSAGDKVKVVFRRDGKTMNATVTLSARPMPEVPATAEALAEIVARKYTEVNRDLTQAFKGVSEEKAARAPAPGGWSARHVLAHLIAEERNLHTWLTDMIAGNEPWYDGETGALRIRLDAVINGFPTVQALLTELKRNEAETVALLNALPDEFVARKGSYRRLALRMLSWPDHAREHLSQIIAAVRH